MQLNSLGTEPKNLASLAWFTKSTLKYTPAIAELMVIVCLLRLLGLVQPFVFQTIIDRVLPFQREATLVLIVVLLNMKPRQAHALHQDRRVAALGRNSGIKFGANRQLVATNKTTNVRARRTRKMQPPNLAPF